MIRRIRQRYREDEFDVSLKDIEAVFDDRQYELSTITNLWLNMPMRSAFVEAKSTAVIEWDVTVHYTIRQGGGAHADLDLAFVKVRSLSTSSWLRIRLTSVFVIVLGALVFFVNVRALRRDVRLVRKMARYFDGQEGRLMWSHVPVTVRSRFVRGGILMTTIGGLLTAATTVLQPYVGSDDPTIPNATARGDIHVAHYAPSCAVPGHEFPPPFTDADPAQLCPCCDTLCGGGYARVLYVHYHWLCPLF